MSSGRNATSERNETTAGADIPLHDGWKRVKLADAVSRVVGGGTPARNKASYWNGAIPWASVKDVSGAGDFLADTQEHITEAGLRSSAANLIERGVPIVCTRMAVGTANLTQVPTAINQDLKALYPADGLDARYLLLILKAQQTKLDAVAVGSTVKGVRLDQLTGAYILLPSLIEQRRIVEILDTVTEAIQQTEALIAKLQQTKAGLLHDLLTYGLNENGEVRDPVARPEQFKHSPLGRIPRGWAARRLEDLAEVGSGVTLGRANVGMGTIELPYLRVANVQDGYVDLTDVKTVIVQRDEVDRFSLQPGDVLMNEGGDFDKLGRGTVWEGQINPCLHQNHVFRVRAFRDFLDPYFLAAFSGSAAGKRYFVLSSKQSTNLASINSTQLKAFPIPTPPLDEQQRIAGAIHSHDARIRAEEAHHAKLLLLKKGLMQDLLTGRVRVPVPEQEPELMEAGA